MLVVQKALPLPGQMIDEQIVGMEKAMREGGASPSRLSGIKSWNQELRERFNAHLIESLRGFIYSVGDAFCFLEKEKAKEIKGVCRPLTAQKVFLPEVAVAILSPYRMWPISQPEAFLAHAYDWYVCGVKTAPQYFRRKEWELIVDEMGELIIRATGECEEVPPRPPRQRAKSVRFKMCYSEKIQGKDSPKK
jgi:hypothetical protein